MKKKKKIKKKENKPERPDGRRNLAESRKMGGWIIVLHRHSLSLPEHITKSNDVRCWPKPAVGGWAEHVRSARVFQTSTCSAIARASSTSMPRYLTVLSILVCPSRSWTALRLPVRR